MNNFVVFEIDKNDTPLMVKAKEYSASHTEEEILNEANVSRVRQFAGHDENGILYSICLQCLVMANRARK